MVDVPTRPIAPSRGRRRPRRAIATLVALLAIAGLVLGWRSLTGHTTDGMVTDVTKQPWLAAAFEQAALEAGPGGRIDPASIASFEWARMFTFGGYSTEEDITATIGFDAIPAPAWLFASDPYYVPEFARIVLFVEDERVTGWFWATDGDFGLFWAIDSRGSRAVERGDWLAVATHPGVGRVFKPVP